MRRSFTRSIFAAAALLGASTTALAQPAPPLGAPNAGPQAAPPPGRDGAAAIGRAYRDIGAAEALGSFGDDAEARRDYADALARYGRGDVAGAAAEARFVSDLAHVALDSREPALPRGLSAPPRVAVAPEPRLPDLTGLQQAVALENTPEARAHAARASAALARATATSDPMESERAARVARDEAAAVRDLAARDHPGALPAPGLGGRRGGPGPLRGRR